MANCLNCHEWADRQTLVIHALIEIDTNRVEHGQMAIIGKITCAVLLASERR
jgi:hypothetical protein